MSSKLMETITEHFSAKGSMNLMGAYTFFAGTNQINSFEPVMEGNFTSFKEGADGEGELLSAMSALPQGLAVGSPFRDFDLFDTLGAEMFCYCFH